MSGGTSSPEDNKGDDFEKYLQDTLFGDKNNPLHPRYEGEDSIKRKEREKLKKESVGKWDLLVPESEIEKIARLEMALLDEENKCPYLRKPHDDESSSFYFCGTRAEYLAPNDKIRCMIGHPSRKAVNDCEEEVARCDFKELSTFCLRGKYVGCEDYKKQLEIDSKLNSNQNTSNNEDSKE